MTSSWRHDMSHDVMTILMTPHDVSTLFSKTYEKHEISVRCDVFTYGMLSWGTSSWRSSISWWCCHDVMTKCSNVMMTNYDGMMTNHDVVTNEKNVFFICFSKKCGHALSWQNGDVMTSWWRHDDVMMTSWWHVRDVIMKIIDLSQSHHEIAFFVIT